MLHNIKYWHKKWGFHPYNPDMKLIKDKYKGTEILWNYDEDMKKEGLEILKKYEERIKSK